MNIEITYKCKNMSTVLISWDNRTNTLNFCDTIDCKVCTKRNQEEKSLAYA